MVYNTLKKQKLLKNLETSPNLRQAAIKAGYSPKNRTIYEKPTKDYISQAIASKPGMIEGRFVDIADRAKRKGDLTNENRSFEALAKINQMYSDVKIDTRILCVNEPVINKYIPATNKDPEKHE